MGRIIQRICFVDGGEVVAVQGFEPQTLRI